MILRPASLRDRLILPDDPFMSAKWRREPERPTTDFLMNPYRFGGGSSSDPYYSNVVFLLDASGMANGATAFVDVKGKTVTTAGNAQAKTDKFIFGTSSAFFDGTGDYLSVPDSSDWAFGTGDFTVEAFAAPNVNAEERYFLSQATALGSFFPFLLGRSASNQFYPRTSNGATILTPGTGGTWANLTFKHAAISRVGNTLYSLFDGAVIGSVSVTGVTFMDSTGLLFIGAYGGDSGSTYPWKGWIDQVRITKGVGRYNGSYTVPSAKFPHA